MPKKTATSKEATRKPRNFVMKASKATTDFHKLVLVSLNYHFLKRKGWSVHAEQFYIKGMAYFEDLTLKVNDPAQKETEWDFMVAMSCLFSCISGNIYKAALEQATYELGEEYAGADSKAASVDAFLTMMDSISPRLGSAALRLEDWYDELACRSLDEDTAKKYEGYIDELKAKYMCIDFTVDGEEVKGTDFYFGQDHATFGEYVDAHKKEIQAGDLKAMQEQRIAEHQEAEAEKLKSYNKRKYRPI